MLIIRKCVKNKNQQNENGIAQRNRSKMLFMKKIQQKTALYAARKKRKISQKELAEKVNTTPQQISLLENGDRKLAPEWIDRLSKALGCTKGELLGEAPLSDDARAVLDLSLIHI